MTIDTSTTLRTCMSKINQRLLVNMTSGFSLLNGDRGEPNEMPCNSDYCPFIYELGGKIGGQYLATVEALGNITPTSIQWSDLMKNPCMYLGPFMALT